LKSSAHTSEPCIALGAVCSLPDPQSRQICREQRVLCHATWLWGEDFFRKVMVTAVRVAADLADPRGGPASCTAMLSG
jgi:hypothetical protein